MEGLIAERTKLVEEYKDTDPETWDGKKPVSDKNCLHPTPPYDVGILRCHVRQNDMLMWLMDEAEGEEKDTRNLVCRILTVNFAAIHTSSMVSTHLTNRVNPCHRSV